MTSKHNQKAGFQKKIFCETCKASDSSPETDPVSLRQGFPANKKSRPMDRTGMDLHGAENETRTRDPNLGKVVLYQLSYFRIGNNMVDYKVSFRFCQ